MARLLRSSRLVEIWRYYQAGVINTLFGLGAYALLVRLGLDIYAAQLLAHLLGMGFNYFTYSRHVFRNSAPAKLRFILSYGANYLVSLAMLALVARFIASPYLAGIVATLIVSVINFFALKFVVFRARAS